MFYVTSTVSLDKVMTYLTKAQYITATIDMASNVTVCGL